MKKEYYCYWCGEHFETQVRYVEGNSDPMNPNSKGKKQALSTQVVCPYCLRTVQTWERKLIGDKKVKVRK